MTERWEDFRAAYVQLDAAGRAYVRRLMAAYVARQNGTATADDLDLIAQSLRKSKARRRGRAKAARCAG
jgi:hypothetical protein